MNQSRWQREWLITRQVGGLLQEASVNAANRDVHLELSQTADKNADRGNR